MITSDNLGPLWVLLGVLWLIALMFLLFKITENDDS